MVDKIFFLLVHVFRVCVWVAYLEIKRGLPCLEKVLARTALPSNDNTRITGC